MGTLTFHCPRTGRPIESGIETDAATMMETASVPVRLICPHCHDEHDPKVRGLSGIYAGCRAHGCGDRHLLMLRDSRAGALRANLRT
jgi:hypothetical protein